MGHSNFRSEARWWRASPRRQREYGWRIHDCEILNARSFAGLLIAGAASSWTVDNNYIHDTYPANGRNQDHLIYVDARAPGGVIERNLLVESPPPTVAP